MIGGFLAVKMEKHQAEAQEDTRGSHMSALSPEEWFPFLTQDKIESAGSDYLNHYKTNESEDKDKGSCEQTWKKTQCLWNSRKKNNKAEETGIPMCINTYVKSLLPCGAVGEILLEKTSKQDATVYV